MPEHHQTICIGAGLSCLSLARSLGGDTVVFERDARPGGLCKSDEVDGFVFDRTGHLLHLRTPRMRRVVGGLLSGNLEHRRRSAWIRSHGVYTRYPFQSHFYGLPPEVAAACLEGLIEARCKKHRGKPRHFADWVLRAFGPGVARHFMFPYNRKLWTVPPDALTTEWLGRFVPRPDLGRVIRGAVSDFHDDAGYNPVFRYPRRGGIGALVAALARGVPGLVCGAGVEAVRLDRRRVVLDSGREISYQDLVSAAPLPMLVRMCRPVPQAVRAAARKLRWASVYNLNLGVRADPEGRSWVYVPEKKYGLYRFGYTASFSSHVAPPGCTGIYTEVAHDPRRRFDRAAARRRVIGDLLSMGVIGSRRDILAERAFDLPVAYAIYDRHRTPAVRTILRFLEKRGVHPIGRYGRWEYSAMEDALLQGQQLAERLRNT